MKDMTSRYSGIKMGEYLRDRGIRLDWLAKQLNVSGAAVTRWTKGSRTMDRNTAERAAKELGVPFSLLFESPIGNESFPKQERIAS